MQTEQQKSLQILINAANVACQKGVFNLQEAKIVAEAVEVFTRETPRETSYNAPEQDLPVETTKDNTK